jgi:hypothetical protein
VNEKDANHPANPMDRTANWHSHGAGSLWPTWTTLQSWVISFENVPAIYDTLLEVSSRCTEISSQVVTFSSRLVGFFIKKTH